MTNLNDKTHATYYNPAAIRTSNMLPDRSTDVVFPDDEPSLTVQSSLAECDINNIVSQHQKTGLLTHVNTRQPTFGDFGDGVDYQQNLNYLMEANAAFAALPAEVRARFNNDPAYLLDFIAKPENVDEAVKLGLATYNEVKTTSSPEANPPSPRGKKITPASAEDATE